MLSANEAKKVKFETSGEEIMEIAAKVLDKFTDEKPVRMLIADDLCEAVAKIVAALVNKKTKEVE